MKHPPPAHRRPRLANRLLAVVLLVAAALPAASWAAAGRPLTTDEYVARLEAARALAESDASRPSSQQMQAVRQAVGLPLDVEVRGAVVHVADDEVLAGLKGTGADDFRRAADHLAAMEDAARAAVAAQPAGRERIAGALRDALRGIRTRPGLTERLRHDLWGIILTVWEWLRRSVRGIPLPPGLIVIIAAAVIGLVVVFLIRRLRYVVPERGAHAGAGARRRTPDWDRLAEEALARGDLAEALRFRYGGLLAALTARGVIPDTPSLTAGECRVATKRGLPGAYPAVARATSLFELAFYGRAPVTRGEVDALREAKQSVRAA